jgi:glutaredoxin-like protein
MGLIKEPQQKQLKEIFKELDGKVKLIVFTQEMECQYCSETRQLMNDIAAFSDKIAVEVYDFVKDSDKVEKYKIDKIPATVIEGEKDYGVRFYGIPAGYEFTSLINSIMAISMGESGLSEKTKATLGDLKDELHIQVFVTLTCPYCPSVVEMSHRIAMESDLITSDMVESAEFPHLTQKYEVKAVPKVIANEDIQFEGAGMSEDEFVESILRALGEN